MAGEWKTLKVMAKLDLRQSDDKKSRSWIQFDKAKTPEGDIVYNLRTWRETEKYHGPTKQGFILTRSQAATLATRIIKALKADT